jgi:hypothetical protein
MGTGGGAGAGGGGAAAAAAAAAAANAAALAATVAANAAAADAAITAPLPVDTESSPVDEGTRLFERQAGGFNDPDAPVVSTDFLDDTEPQEAWPSQQTASGTTASQAFGQFGQLGGSLGQPFAAASGQEQELAQLRAMVQQGNLERVRTF